MRDEIQFEYQPRPDKHEDQLRERQQRAEAELTGQQGSHGDARTQHPVQRSTLGFVQERPARTTGGEEQEHNSNGRGVERHHGIVFVLTDHIAASHCNGHAAVGVGSRGLLAAALRAFPPAQCFQAGFYPLPLFRRKTAGVLIHVLRSLFRHDGCNHVAAVFEQLDRRPVLVGAAE